MLLLTQRLILLTGNKRNHLVDEILILEKDQMHTERKWELILYNMTACNLISTHQRLFAVMLMTSPFFHFINVPKNPNKDSWREKFVTGPLNIDQ